MSLIKTEIAFVKFMAEMSKRLELFRIIRIWPLIFEKIFPNNTV